MSTTLELVRALSDPTPPIPDRDARAAVARRSTTIVRRRRLAQGVGALTCIAAVAVGVVAITRTVPASRRTVDAAAAPPASQQAGARLSIDTGDAIPAGVELDIVLASEGATFHAHVRTPGAIALDAVMPGDYELRWSWTSDDGTATAAGRIPVHVDHEDLALTL